jgi:hypothetical protein
MNERSSTASVRDFEVTAIKKLVAEGVPRHVAHAFVTLGVVKNSQLYERLRDVVCPMDFHEFFIPISAKDHSDPLRAGGTGALVPRIARDETPRFYTQFAMTDIEAVRFEKAFPELHVVNIGKTYNQHAYYANKRCAETELLIIMVHRHARKGGFALNPSSVVDLGGNRPYHVKRDRESVHCENPVLSGRDKARYVVREIFSDDDPNLRCTKKFEECEERFDYAIGVHSTYDLTPRKIAAAMRRRGISVFFGTMNCIPGLAQKSAGVYEADGLVADLVRGKNEQPFVKYTFRYDTAVEYSHSLSDANSYMFVEKLYEFVEHNGSSSKYVYKIEGVRGCSLVFSIMRVDASPTLSDTIWTPRSTKQYSLSMRAMGVAGLDVDCELFDRLVLQAAGARNFEEYDIVALFRYAKSLRQRVSINGIVLSSGFCMKPEELVYVVIAAYTVAAAFRIESARYFKKASTQIMAKRGSGSILRTVLTVASVVVKRVTDSLSSFVGKSTGYTAFNNVLKKMVESKFPVEVVVDKPHAGRGLPTMSFMTRMPPMSVPGTSLVKSSDFSRGFTPLAVGGLDPQLTVTSVSCSGEIKRFSSYGVPSLSRSERVRDCRPVFHEFTVRADYPVISEEYRAIAYGTVLRECLGHDGWNYNPLIAVNGDRIYRRAPVSQSEGAVYRDSADRFITPLTQYVVFRGVGSRAVSLGKPKVYMRGVCLNFVLFYERDEDEYAAEKLASIAAASTAEATGSTAVGQSVVSRDDWDLLLGKAKSKGYENEADARRAVQEDLDKGYPVMTGALRNSTSTPPISLASTPVGEGAGAVYRVRGRAESEVGTTGDDRHSGRAESPYQFDWAGDGVESVSPSVYRQPPDVPLTGAHPGADASSSESSGQARAAAAMGEYVRACEESEKIAIEVSRSYIDLAAAVAVGHAPANRWGALRQGTPGDPIIVRVRGDSWVDHFTGDEVPHMAISDGERVYDRLTSKPVNEGLYVTSNEMLVYTGSSIRATIAEMVSVNHECETVSMNGVAGSGKTFQIVEEATLQDVVLCETSAAWEDTKKKLARKFGVEPRGATVDSFLIHKQFDRCDVLYIDESFRLHAAKIYAVIRLLKPRIVYAFGDSKQIPVLPYVPAFDFYYHEFPFDRVVLKRDTWRCPGDVSVALSQPQYYGFPMLTHNAVRRSMRGPLPYDSSMFVNKPHSVVLLTYSKAARDDLKKQGVTNVMTIGQAQGCTLEDVVLFRDSDLKKVLYYDAQQALVAVTRHTRSFTYVTVAMASDDSAVARIYSYLASDLTDVVLSQHFIPDASDSDVDDFATRVSPVDEGLFEDEPDIVDYL